MTKEKEKKKEYPTQSKTKQAAAEIAKAKVIDVNTKGGLLIPEIQEDFQYNRGTYDSYIKNGFKVPDEVDYQERMFLGTVNTEKEKGNGPIKREVTRIVRLKARDYDSPVKGATKEYLVWYENWYGKNWLGEDIAPVTDHIEGMHMEQEKKTTVNRDMRTGRLLSPVHKRSGEYPVHYIPFTREKVDEIAAGVDKDSIIYTIKFPGGIRNNFSYDHFTNLSYEEAFKLNAKAGGSSMNPLTASNAIRSESGIS